MLSIIDSGALSTRILGTVRVLQQDYASGFTGKLAVAGTQEDAWLAFSIQPMAPGPSLPKPVTLAAIKADSTLAEMAMLKRSRLSVVPVTSEEFAHILHMGACKLSRRVKT